MYNVPWLFNIFKDKYIWNASDDVRSVRITDIDININGRLYIGNDGLLAESLNYFQ